MKPYYDEKGITIYHTDCLPAMKEMPDNAFDLAIVEIHLDIRINYVYISL